MRDANENQIRPQPKGGGDMNFQGDARQPWGPAGLNPQSWEALRGYGETHHVDESREEHQGDGEHPDQGAVLLGSHYLPGECLQGSGEELGQEGREETKQKSVRTPQKATELRGHTLFLE